MYNRKSNYLLDTIFCQRKLQKCSRLKPFGFCCSVDRFNSLSRCNQQKPPYKSSLTAISSVHECPVSKIQVAFFTSPIFREKKKSNKIKVSDTEDQQQLKNDRLNYFQGNENNCSVKWCLEDEIVLAKDIFWAEKQRVYKEASNKAFAITKKKSEFINSWYKNTVK